MATKQLTNFIETYLSHRKQILAMERTAKLKQISFNQFVMLHMLSRETDLGTAAFAKKLNTSQAATARKLTHLQKLGYLEKLYGQSADQRHVQLVLTDAGKKLYRSLARQYQIDLEAWEQ